jgi:uncharacterized protein (UPF0297 family)
MKTECLICQCLSPEHTLQFIYDEEDKEIHTRVYLNQYRTFWKRILVAIKYVFGYKCSYGDWDTFIMRQEDLEKIIKMCEETKSS